MAFAGNDVTLDIDLRPWQDDDLGLMQRLLGDPVMMQHLGGPESPEKIARRHRQFVESGMGDEAVCVRVIVAGADRIPAGSIGYWARSWQEQRVYEAGWSVLPELQRRGVASRALQMIVRDARQRGQLQFMHAFPGVNNIASNAVCRKGGFTLLGAADFEYPPGSWMRCNDWSIDLGQPLEGSNV